MEGTQGKQKEGSGEESAGAGGGGGGQARDVPGGGQDPESAATPKPKQKAGVDPATAHGGGVPSQPSTLSGVVSNGPKPGGAAERKGCRAGLPACTQAPEASHTRHQGDLPNQNLAQREGVHAGLKGEVLEVP